MPPRKFSLIAAPRPAVGHPFAVVAERTRKGGRVPAIRVKGPGPLQNYLIALKLGECVAKGSDGIGRRLFRAAGRLIDNPWQIAVGSDLQNERVEGKRTAQVRFVNWYIARLFQSANRDPFLATKFLEVANLTKAPSTLLSPAVAVRVWKGQSLT